MRASQGFTLIELMIVVAIIGILAAVGIPAYRDYIARSQVNEAVSLAAGLKLLVVESYSDGVCSDNTSAGPSATNTVALAIDTSISGKYVEKVTTGGVYDSSTGGCTITATMRSANISTLLHGKVLVYKLINNSGSVSWECNAAAGTNIPANYLVKSCL